MKTNGKPVYACKSMIDFLSNDSNDVYFLIHRDVFIRNSHMVYKHRSIDSEVVFHAISENPLDIIKELSKF